jgi:CRISPR-associated endonuclease Cas2
MYYLISYDISNNRLRTQIAKTILAAGATRLQKSLFLGEFNAIKIKELEVALRGVLGTKNLRPDNNILMIPVAPHLLAQTQCIGENITLDLALSPPTTFFF